MKMTTVRLTPDFFEGAVSIEKGRGWIKAWRIPFAQRGLFPSPGDNLLTRSEHGSGVRLRFETDAAVVGLRIVSLNEAHAFDLTLDGKIVGSQKPAAGTGEVLFDSLPKGRKVLELWLPQFSPVQARALIVNAGAKVRLVPDRRPKWVTYGSSITHCRAAHSPARTWPATVARTMGWNLTCLGYGGQCHLDPMIARMIRDLPADFISLKLGINVMGASSLSLRTFRPAIIGLVQIIREKHPRTPIAVVSPILSPPRETTDNAVGQSLTKMREQVSDAVARLCEAGDKNIRYVNGLDLFGEKLVKDYLPDNLHPNGDGYEILGRNFVKVVAKKVRL